MSKIEWTEQTWNPIVGCSKISQGCKHCYAETMAKRLKAMGQPQYQNVVNGHWTGKIEFVPSALDKPLKRKKPTMYFVNSMSDMFHSGVTPEMLMAIWNVMQKTPQHNYQILTKRAIRMQSIMNAGFLPMLPNAWLGVSVEDNSRIISRIDELKNTPAVVKFISFEPLLADIGNVDLKGVDWAIVGAESGHGARPMDEDWVRNIRDICQRDNVAFFYKQNVVGGKKIPLPELDWRQWAQYPTPNNANVADGASSIRLSQD